MNQRRLYEMILAVLVTSGIFLLHQVVAAEPTAAPWEPTGKETRQSFLAQAGELNRPRQVGIYYEATVPDTLDLAERASWAINHFTSLISEERDYEMFWGVHGLHYGADMLQFLGRRGHWKQWGHDFNQANPPVMHCTFSPLMACQPKAMEALALLRLMAPTQQNLAREANMLEMLASKIGEDGVYYVYPDPKKWWLGPADLPPYANTHGQARMLRAMIAWYQYTGNDRWKHLAERMVDGMDRHLVVHKENYAYVPIHGHLDQGYFRACYLKGRGWKDTSEPMDVRSGEESSLFNDQGHWPGALATWYTLTRNEQALRLSGELARFLTQSKFWGSWSVEDYPGVVGGEHAHWEGHFHGTVNTLRAILEYAIATNDPQLKLFAREGYEWSRQAGIARIGLVGDGQGCGLGRLLGVAIKLTEAGIGDYWEDVDQYIRNQGVEMQFAPEDIAYMQEIGAGKPPAPHAEDPCYTTENVYQTAVGGYSWHAPFKVGTALCCSPHGAMGLFYVWDAMMRYQDGVAHVHLLLNRASPWMDIDSYLPYEGKVVIRNKTAREALVRVPLWVDRDDVQCSRQGDEESPKWFGSYLRFDALEPADELVITFPMREWIETWTAPELSGYGLNAIDFGARFKMRFRGNTLVQITPALGRSFAPDAPGKPIHGPDSPLYQKRLEKYESDKTPMKSVTRYVTPLIVKW